MSNKKEKSKNNGALNSIKVKFIFMMTLILIIGIATLDGTMYLISKNVLTTNFESTARSLSKSTELAINGFLSEYEGIVAAAVKSDEFSGYDGSAADLKTLQSYIDSILAEYPSVRYMYLGTESGQMIMRPSEELPAGYDPRIRPWYQDALKTDEIVWTQPYVDATSQALMVTCTAKVTDKNNRLLGVIGVDLTLEKLSELVNSIKIGETGYPALVDGNFLTMTSPNPELIGKEVPVAEINDALKVAVQI